MISVTQKTSLRYRQPSRWGGNITPYSWFIIYGSVARPERSNLYMANKAVGNYVRRSGIHVTPLG